MPTRKVLFHCTLLATVFAAACSNDSPTAVDLSPEHVLFAKGGQSGGCIFLTPNGTAHEASANSARCPTVAELAGTYEATRLVVEQEGESFDLLSSDEVVLEITLNPDGTTSGRFYVPPVPGESGSGMDVELSGTWSLNGNQVTFEHDEETAIEELSYTVRGKRLVAKGTVVPRDPFGLDIVLSPK